MLEVTAEGVESEDQLASLRCLQCTKVQGYLFSIPLPTERITKLLQKHACVSILPSGVDLGKQPQGVAGLLNLAAEVSEGSVYKKGTARCDPSGCDAQGPVGKEVRLHAEPRPRELSA